MATEQDCEQALHDLAAKLAANDPSRRPLGFDRSLTCAVRDLGIVFSGRLKHGLLVDLGRASKADGQVRLAMTSDDLVDLVAGKVKIASAWATGRIKVEAGVRDLIKLRSIF